MTDGDNISLLPDTAFLPPPPPTPPPSAPPGLFVVRAAAGQAGNRRPARPGDTRGGTGDMGRPRHLQTPFRVRLNRVTVPLSTAVRKITPLSSILKGIPEMFL